MLFQPPPVSATSDHTHACLRNTIRAGYLLLAPVFTSNCTNRCLGEFGLWGCCPPASGPVRQHIGEVAAAAIPAQILQAVVLPIAVIVASVRFVWGWAKKRAQNQTVHVFPVPDIAAPQVNHAVFPRRALVPCGNTLLHAVGAVDGVRDIASNRLHAPMVANFVGSLETGNGLPNFFCHPRNMQKIPAHYKQYGGR